MADILIGRLMKRYRLLLIFVLAALLGSCQVKEKMVPEGGCGVRYSAVSETARVTRTAFERDGGMVYVKWNAGDLISIFAKSTLNRKDRFTGEDGATKGDFEEVAGSGGESTALTMSYAVSPYSEDYSINSDGVVALSWPAVQTYRADNYDPSAAIMLARSADENLSFLHAGGYFSISLYGEGISVRSITLAGADNEPLAGPARIWVDKDGESETVALEFLEGASKSIKLNILSPVALPADKEHAVEFWFCVPPTEFAQGFVVTVEDTGGRQTVFQSQSKNSVIRAAMRRMVPVKISMDGSVPTKPGIYPASGSEQVFDAENWQLSCYREDGKAWLRAVNLTEKRVIKLGPIPESPTVGVVSQASLEAFSFSTPGDKTVSQLTLRVVSASNGIIALSDEEDNYYVMRY